MADDYISRQAAIKAVNSYLHFAEWKPKIKEVLEMAVYDCSRTLEQLPPADVKPVVRGKWIVEVKHHKDEEQDFYYQDIRCSECGAFRRISWYDVNFCPNCGSDMRGESDE